MTHILLVHGAWHGAWCWHKLIPALQAGSWGVHVPHQLTWALERADPPHGHPRFAELPDLSGFAALLRGFSA